MYNFCNINLKNKQKFMKIKKKKSYLQVYYCCIGCIEDMYNSIIV